MQDLQVFTICGDRFAYLTLAGMCHISHIQNLVELAYSPFSMLFYSIFSFDYNPLVSDGLLVDICDGLPHLKTLSLANAGSDTAITLAGLSAISKLKELEQLDVSWLAAVRAKFIQEIASSCPLEVVQLRNCVYLNDEGVSALKSATKLRHVDLSGSILISSEPIQELIQAFPHSPQVARLSNPITLTLGSFCHGGCRWNRSRCFSTESSWKSCDCRL